MDLVGTDDREDELFAFALVGSPVPVRVFAIAGLDVATVRDTVSDAVDLAGVRNAVAVAVFLLRIDIAFVGDAVVVAVLLSSVR